MLLHDWCDASVEHYVVVGRGGDKDLDRQPRHLGIVETIVVGEADSTRAQRLGTHQANSKILLPAVMIAPHRGLSLFAAQYGSQFTMHLRYRVHAARSAT